MTWQASARTFLAVGALIVSSCGKKEQEPKESFSKRAAKFATEQALDVVEGVSEVVEQRGDEAGEKLSRATGEVVAGVAEGSKKAMDARGDEIGQNLKAASDALEKTVKQTPSKHH